MMTRFFVKHPVTTWMIFAAFAVMAVYALPKIQIEAMPEIDLPSLTVSTQWNGASPKAIQRAITLPVEEASRKVYGVESVKSQSRAGRSVVEVEFRRDVDIDFARLNLNESLAEVRQNLPLNASQPQILPFVPEEFETEQFFTFTIESPLTPNELRDKAEDWIVPQVLAIDGVADATVQGGARPLLKIWLDRTRLDLYGITADQVFGALNSLDELMGAGAIRQDGLEKLVALRDPVDIEKIENAVVAQLGQRSYRLNMVGRVEQSFEDPMYFVRSNGLNTVKIQVEKRSGANSVSVSRRLRSAIPDITANTPFQARLDIERDEGKDLEDKLRELIIRSAAILVLLSILLIISLRQGLLTVIVIGSIVFALVICLTLFYFFKLSVNFITISGLTICFGMLLDNSILVLDSIHRRLEGLDRADEAGLSWRSKLKVAQQTIVAGTSEVVFPILATTLTTMVAFLSFIFLSGRLALYYVPLAISVGMAMFASVFVAFGWIPVVLNQTWAARHVRKSKDGPNEVDDAHELDELVEEIPDLESKPSWAHRSMEWVQRGWFVILPAAAVLMLWVGILPYGIAADNWKDPSTYSWKFWEDAVYQSRVIKGGFGGWLQNDEKLIFFMRGAEGQDVRVTSENVMKFEELLMPIHEGARMSSTVWSNQGYIEIEFDDDTLQTGVPMLYRALLTDLADNTGGVTIFINGFSDQPYIKGTFGGAALNSLIKVSGYNSKKLEEIAETTLAKVSTNRRVRNARITSSNRWGRSSTEETVIQMRRDVLAEHGLTVSEVVGYVRRLLGLDFPWNMLIDGEQEQVQLSFTDAETIEFSEIADRVIETSQGEQVRLGDLVTMQKLPLSDAISREDQRYTMFVNWEYVGTDRMRKAYLQGILGSMDLPYGYAAEESERQFLTEEEESDLQKTILLAVGFIFMVLAALFNSPSLPFLVLNSVPLALVGVYVIFWKAGVPFDSSAKVGLVLLFGVVVNNAILLISRFRHEAAAILRVKLGGDPEAEAALFDGQRKDLGGSDLWHVEDRARLLRWAVARATIIRLRSILLTSGTTIVGLLPLLFHWDSVRWTISLKLFEFTLPFRIRFLDTESQDIWENLALASVGGLISSTILILLVVPSLYYFCVRFGWILRRVMNRVMNIGRPGPSEAPSINVEPNVIN